MSRAFTKERDDAPEPVLTVPRKHFESAPPPQDRSLVGVGATVTVEGVLPGERTFKIAGDRTDIDEGLLGVDSPLAEALIGARKGARVVWHRPAGDRKLRVVALSYDDAG